MTPARQGRAPVEHADVVKPQEPSLEHVLTEPVLTVHPPGEVQHQFAKAAPEEFQVALAVQRLLRLVEENRGPCMYWRVDIAKVPLVCGSLTGRMQKRILQQQVELLFCELDIHGRERYRMKGQIPGRIP